MDVLAAQEEFFAARRSLKDSPHTTAAYRRDLLAINRHLARIAEVTDVSWVKVVDVDGALLREAFGRFSADHAKSSVVRAWSTWNQFLTFCVAEDYVAGNPMGAVARPRLGQVTPKPLRGEDTPEKLLEAVSAGGRKTRNPWPERDVVVVALGLIAGVRSAEMRALQVGSIVGRAGEKRLHVVGKGSKERSVPIADSMIRIIDAYVASGKAKFPGSKWGRTDPLIRDNSGEEIGRGALDYLVQQCFRSAGLHDRVPSGARLHALRHTFATRLAEDGASATEIMGLLGHASLTSSQNYIEATGAHRRQAAAANRTYQALDKLA